MTRPSSSYPGLLTRLWRYVALFVKQPTELATLVPSSPILRRKLAEDPCISQAQHLVELGPGDGGTTRALLQAMRPDARLLAVEKAAAFVDFLRTIDDHRCVIEHADACDLEAVMRRAAMNQADVIVSGIPFSNLDPAHALQVIDAVHSALVPGGTFLAYQVRDHVNELARCRFGDAEVTFVPWNLPPVHLYRWKKASIPKVDPAVVPLA